MLYSGNKYTTAFANAFGLTMLLYVHGRDPLRGLFDRLYGTCPCGVQE